MSIISSEKNKYIKCHGYSFSKFRFLSCVALLINILYIYACWYVQTFPGVGIVVKGSVAGIMLLFLLHIIFEAPNGLYVKAVPKGVWMNFIICFYFFIVGPFVAYNVSVLVNSLIIYTGYAVTSIVICYISTTKKSIDWFLNLVIFTALFCGAYALAKGERYYGYALQLSAHNNIHIFAVVLVFGIFALAVKTKNTIGSLITHFLPATFLLYCIMESSSRKCLIASAIIISIWLLFSLKNIIFKKKTITKIVIIVLVIICLFICFKFLGDFYQQSQISRKFSTFTNEESNSGRIDLYKIAWNIFLEKPLFGGGFDQYQFWSGRGGYSHSTYAEAIADFGLFGTILYFLPIFIVGIKLIKLIASGERVYKNYILFAFYISEVFLGIGQIYFLEPQHIFIWTVIYWLEMSSTDQNIEKREKNKIATKNKYTKKNSAMCL